MMGDGGFWHNGLTSGVGNAVFNKERQRPGSSSTTAIRRRPGGQDIPSSFHPNANRGTMHSIEKAVPASKNAASLTMARTAPGSAAISPS